MVLQNLRKSVGYYRQQLGSTASFNQLEVLQGLPFYSDWDKSLSQDFNHAIGLPQKQDRPMPLFDYEQLLYNTLETNKHVWIKKATGLGVTEFMLRYMAWLCFQEKIEGPSISGSQMCIVTGPRIELAITLIDRMKGLFVENIFNKNIESKASIFDTKETVIDLNGIHIEAYPSHHLDAMRGLKDVSFIYLDEADFFPPGQQQDARDVSERYIGKSNPWIVMVSTPNAPEGLFEKIEKEAESTCLYKRLFLDYTYGLDRIYSGAEIDAAKASPSFEREYNLKYLGLIGNVFHTKDIDAAIEKGRQPQFLKLNNYSKKSVGIDPAFGSSAFGICITELVDDCINVIFSEEYPRADFDQMISITTNLLDKYNIRFDNDCRIYVDGANPSVIRTLKRQVDEDTNYEDQINRWKAENGANAITLKWLAWNMFVLPVQFSKYHKDMLAHCKEILEYRSGFVAINPDKHNKLITSLRTAVEDGDGSLDKEVTSHDDVFDAFRLSLMRWNLT